MKRQWDIEELIEHFTLVKKDLDLFANKSGPIQLGLTWALTLRRNSTCEIALDREYHAAGLARFC